MSRGNGGQQIFLGDDDSLEFLRLLRKAKGRFGFKLYAYCLMPNHFHLLLRQQIASISKIMQWLLTCYAKTFNRRRNRHGHLFQGRFLSPVCKDDRYFLGLLRYIHLNPVRSKLVRRPGEWLWSGQNELVSPREGGLLDLDYPLSLFNQERILAVAEYERFLGNSDDGPEDDIDLTGKECLPSGLAMADELCEDIVRESSSALEQVAVRVCQERNLSVSALQSGSQVRALAQARKIFVCRAVGCGARPSDIAAFLNRVPSAISNLLRTCDRCEV